MRNLILNYFKTTRNFDAVYINKKIYTFSMYSLFLSFILSCSTTHPTSSGDGFFLNHNILQMIGWYLFPRLMFWFFSAITGGLFFWIGVLIVPRYMAAYWGTVYYWDTNPILCTFVWIHSILYDINEYEKRKKNRLTNSNRKNFL